MKGLEGIKVVELTGYVAAPCCPRILGEMGAEIIKIEPLSGDEQRTQGPGFGMTRTEREDPAFDMSSMNKNWVSINLKSPKGMVFLHQIIKDADILITSFRDKALIKLGLDYETLHARYPGLVYGHMRGYGDRGPNKDAKGFDATAYSARGGLFTSLPQKGDEPVNIPVAMGDFNASTVLTAGVLGALVRKCHSGLGDKVMVNLYHCALWAMQIPVVSRQSGAEYPRSRKEVPCPFNNTYKAGDGVWFLICNGNYNKYYEEMMTAFGLGHMVGNKDYDTLEKLVQDGTSPYIISLLEDAFEQKDFSEWETIFRQHEIPYEKCFLIDDILVDEEAYANDSLRRVHYEDFGDRAIPTSPLRMQSLGDPELRKSKPIGYHTQTYMLRYGYTQEDVQKMDAEGTVKCYHGDPVQD